MQTRTYSLRLLTRLRASAMRRVRMLWERCDLLLMRLAVRSGPLSSWYYAAFNRAFDREHRAVLAGRLKYESSRTNPEISSSLLRRNTHRLEKGLLMRPRRSIFALGYIEETVKAFASAAERAATFNGFSRDELAWSHDVLSEYFSVVDQHHIIEKSRGTFEAARRKLTGAVVACRKVPYPRDLDSPPSVKYDDLLELARRRRSVRWFQQKAVPRELIEKAMDVAALSPSACNRQPFYFHIFDEPELVREISALPGGTKGFDHNFPAIITIIGQLRNYYGERDRHLIYIDASLAAMSFVLAAESLGLSTCCINWPDIEEYERRCEQILALAPDERPIMFIAVGFPDEKGLVAYSQKKTRNYLWRYN